MTALLPGLLAASELRDLRAVHDATLVHRAALYVPTRTTGAGGTTVETWDPTPLATAVPCRYDAPQPGPPARLVAGAVAAPPEPIVAVAAGTTIPATARLHVTGTSGGVAVDCWLAVQGAPEPGAIEVGRAVRVAPAPPVPGGA